MKSLSELKMLQSHIYKYFLSNMDAYSDELVDCIAKFTKSEYHLECPEDTSNKENKDSKKELVMHMEMKAKGVPMKCTS